MSSWLALALIASFLASYVLTAWARRFAQQSGMLDLPGPRRSHEQPTPRGGGIGFATIFLVAVTLFIRLFPENMNLWLGLLGGGFLVVAVGWLDDLRGLGSAIRLSLYGFASLWAVVWIGGLPSVELGVGILNLGIFGYFVGWCLTLGFLNIYNFMDGIDGIAAGEGLIASSAAAAFLILAGSWPMAIACLILSAGLLGFIPWNWHPAKIFMGDVGSNLLGFVLIVMAMFSENQGFVPLLVWIILLAVFWVDGGATFLRRLWKGDPVYLPHRTHAYQRAVQKGYSHSQVTSAVIVIDIILVGLGYLAWSVPMRLLPVVAGVLIGLFILYLHFSASSPPSGISG